MQLNAKEVLKTLKSKGVAAFYHANTVQTSCVFLQQGRLMARGVVEERGFSQTDQQTDQTDKRDGLWNDIFFDDIDIHSALNKRNFYGPVTFVFDVDLLADDRVSHVWVTKSNPQNWNINYSHSDRWFTSLDELDEKYATGELGQIIALRQVAGIIPFKPFLSKIIIDNIIREEDKIDLRSQAIGALKVSSKFGGLTNLNIETRDCPSYCKCSSEYYNMYPLTAKKFFAP